MNELKIIKEKQMATDLIFKECCPVRRSSYVKTGFVFWNPVFVIALHFYKKMCVHDFVTTSLSKDYDFN